MVAALRLSDDVHLYMLQQKFAHGCFFRELQPFFRRGGGATKCLNTATSGWNKQHAVMSLSFIEHEKKL